MLTYNREGHERAQIIVSKPGSMEMAILFNWLMAPQCNAYPHVSTLVIAPRIESATVTKTAAV